VFDVELMSASARLRQPAFMRSRSERNSCVPSPGRGWRQTPHRPQITDKTSSAKFGEWWSD